jgi:hypothetical protein
VPEPIEFRIVQSLQTALRGISTASGYFYTVAALAVKLDPNVDVESLIGDTKLRPFVVLELPPDTFGPPPFAPMGARVTMPFILHGVHDSDPTVDSSWIQTYYRLCADLEQAIAPDITRGGLAVVTKLIGREAVGFNGAQVWVKVTGEVQVVRTYGAPNG